MNEINCKCKYPIICEKCNTNFSYLMYISRKPICKCKLDNYVFEHSGFNLALGVFAYYGIDTDEY